MEFRIDRLATLYLVDRIQRRISDGKRSVPILMYHSIADEDEKEIHAYYRTATARTVFATQMSDLHNAGYTVLSLADAVGRLADSSQTMARDVVITFDDGYRNFYTNAFPILNQHGYTATMFLPTSQIGKSRQTFKGRECLTWGEVRELQSHGISFGSHTVTHPQLYRLDARKIEEEVVASKETIEHELGCAVESFAYPYAFPEADVEFKKQLRQTLCQAGYKYGVCTTVGRPTHGSDLLFLKRLPVNSSDDVRLFRAKLTGAYDWLGKPQYLLKWAKHTLNWHHNQ
jgi:peptidoglycan/xylan/chitin deacetylase (PgdA/CDA1 family)